MAPVRLSSIPRCLFAVAALKEGHWHMAAHKARSHQCKYCALPSKHVRCDAENTGKSRISTSLSIHSLNWAPSRPTLFTAAFPQRRDPCERALTSSVSICRAYRLTRQACSSLSGCRAIASMSLSSALCSHVGHHSGERRRTIASSVICHSLPQLGHRTESGFIEKEPGEPGEDHTLRRCDQVMSFSCVWSNYSAAEFDSIAQSIALRTAAWILVTN